MNRREFVRTAGGATGGAAALHTAGGAAAQEDGGNETAGNETDGGGSGGEAPEPDYGSFFQGVGNFDGSTVDARGQDQVTVTVGAEGNSGTNAFAPPAIHVDNGATVQWEWTGEGSHNVVSPDDGPLDSGSAVSEAGVNYEFTFDEDGLYEYICIPHESLGMKGAVVVGSDYPSVAPDAVETLNPEEAGVPIQPHFVGIATGLMLIVAVVFTFFTLKYGESAHTSGGND